MDKIVYLHLLDITGIADCENAGKIPVVDHRYKQRRLEHGSVCLALIKKQGVLQQPPPCWTNDPKINPRADHLLWATVILGSEEDISAAAGLLITELQEKPGDTDADTVGQVLNILKELPAMVPGAKLKESLSSLITKAEKVIH